MIFPVCGPGGSGKSATIEAVRDRLIEAGYNAVIRDSITRKDFTEKYDLNELRKDQKAYRDYQMKLLELTIDLELSLSKRHKLLLTDRSVLDGFIYVLLYVRENKDAFAFRYLKKALEHFERYEKLFILEPLDFFERNGIRDSDEEYVYDVYQILNMFKKTQRVCKASLDARADFIFRKIIDCCNS